MTVPWEPERLMLPGDGGWTNVVAPSALAFADNYAQPYALDGEGIRQVKQAFAAAAKRALDAGFDAIEIHAAHGYLLHEFFSPLSNKRTDLYGGGFENRIRLLMEVVQDVRAVWPESKALLVRISASDWTEGGWSLDESITLAKLLKERGVDLIDVSSGGNSPTAQIPVGPGYQTPFAEEIRRQAEVRTGAVGMITSASQADQMIRNGQADLIFIAREFLRDPYWPINAAHKLHKKISWPAQYLRAAERDTAKRESLARQ